VERSAAGERTGRCGPWILAIQTPVEVADAPVLLRSAWFGLASYSPPRVRAFRLERVSGLERIESSENELLMVDLRRTGAGLAATFVRVVDSWQLD
jgi:hypothetical protein